MATTTAQIRDFLGREADDLLSYTAKGFPKSALHLPGPNFVGDNLRSQCVSTADGRGREAAESGAGYLSGFEHHDRVSGKATDLPKPV
jgi:hypothetical protein